MFNNIPILWLIISITLIFPFLVPIPSLNNTVKPELLAYTDSSFIEIDKLKIHTRIDGDGEDAIILLHGFGSGTHSWNYIIKSLSKYDKVIAYDRFGFGLTPRPIPYVDFNYTNNPYSSEYQPELIIKIMDKLNIKKAVLTGHSAGGLIAVRTAIKYPERIKGLILISPAINLNTNSLQSYSILNTIGSIPQIDHFGSLISRNFVSVGEGILDLSFFDKSKLSDTIKDEYKKILKVQNWDIGFWEFIKSQNNYISEEDIKNILIPTYIITGSEDKIVNPSSSKNLSKLIKNVHYFEITNCGHLPQEETPEELLKIINNYFNYRGETE